MGSPVELLSISREHAVAICDKIRDNMTAARNLLVELYDGQGWKALGYMSWRECVATEFGQHQRMLYRELEAAKVVREIEAATGSQVFDTCVKQPEGDNPEPFRPSDMPARPLVALAKAPEGTRAEVLGVAAEAAGGKPTERVVKAAVEAKAEAPDAPRETLVQAVKAAVEAPLKPSGKTIVNGVEQEDKAVAKARAAGRIPEGVAVTVEDPGDDETDIESIREEREERAAIESEVTDDEWLATLPLSSQLEGLTLKRFQMDALHYRRLESKRRGVLQANGAAVKKVFRATRWRGHVQASISWWLRMESPDRWRKCSPADKGGCDGTGVVPILGGDCDICKGKGYIAR